LPSALVKTRTKVDYIGHHLYIFGMQTRRESSKGYGAATAPPVEPSAFEKLAARLGVKERDWAKSESFRKWASKHRNNRYVPEALLKHWNLPLRVNKETGFAPRAGVYKFSNRGLA
jgi:hypothetical protein